MPLSPPRPASERPGRSRGSAPEREKAEWHMRSAAIAGSEPTLTGFEAFKLAIGGVIVPFIFVHHPALILQGSWHETLAVFVLATACIILTSAALEGWLLGPTPWAERILLLLAAGGLVVTSRWVAVAAGLLALALVGWQVARFGWRRAPVNTTGQAES